MPESRTALSSLRAAASPRILVTLLALVVLSTIVKVAYLQVLESRPGFAWGDPDGYLRMASTLTRTGEWVWTPDATRYEWNNTAWTLPPGYPVFLSAWYRAPHLDPRPAALAQIAWSGLGVVALFWLVAAMHSPRAGLASAAIYAFWFPALVSPHVFVQEPVFIPLIISALAALAVCLVAGARPWAFAAAGTLLALATLTRAIPLYFLPVLFLVFNLGSRATRPNLIRQAAYFGAVLLFVVPYVTWLSVERGRLILIDDHAAIVQTSGGPGSSLTVRSMAGALASRAVGDLPGRASMARGMMQVYGRSWLYRQSAASDRASARRTEWAVWLWLDVLFVGVALLAPWGLAAASNRRLAVLLVLWAAFTVAIAVAAGFSGARYRSPLEFVFIAGAGIALTTWRWPVGKRRLAVAAATSLVVALITVPQLSASFRARSAFGWLPEPASGGESVAWRALGDSGFYAVSRQRTLALTIEAAGDEHVAFGILVNGRQVRRVVVVPGRATELRLAVVTDGAHFVELVPEPLRQDVPYRIASR